VQPVGFHGKLGDSRNAVRPSSVAASAGLAASDTPVGDDASEPVEVAFPSGRLTLDGFVFRPRGTGPFPAIVFNHGSEAFPGNKAGQARFFVPHGFVLFVPHRRGQGRSQDAGTYINDFYEAGAQRSSTFVDALVTQSDDVMAAVAYAASLPYVDAQRIAVSGCSLGRRTSETRRAVLDRSKLWRDWAAGLRGRSLGHKKRNAGNRRRMRRVPRPWLSPLASLNPTFRALPVALPLRFLSEIALAHGSP
jgi:hypothetical protein